MTKQQILQRTSQLEIYQAYLPELTADIVKSTKNICSPFRKDKNPSFSIYEYQNKILFKDNATGETGDVWQFVANSENLDCKTQFKKVLHKIDGKLKLGLNGKPYSNNIAATSKTWIPTYYEEFTQEALTYWETFKITPEILTEYNFKQLKRLKKVNPKKPKGFDFYEFEKLNRLGFENRINNRPELYIPKQKGFNRKLIMKLQKKEDIFGLAQLPRKVKWLIITEGKKDVMCLKAHDFHAITFQSASIYPTRAQMREIKKRAKYIFIGYDNQPKAKTQAKAIAKKYNLIHFEIPTEIEGADIADWLPTAPKHALDAELEEKLEEWESKNKINLWEYDNAYWKFDSKAEREKAVSNFILDVEALIVGQETSQRIVTIQSNEQKTVPFSVDTKVFSSPSEFTKFVESKGNFYYYGTPADLMNIKRTAFDLCQFATESQAIGYDPKTQNWILSNGIIDKGGNFHKPNQYGIVQNTYIAAAAEENQFNPNYRAAQKYQFTNRSDFDSSNFIYHLSELYGQPSALISIAHIFASTVFDHIGSTLKEFPLLNIYGKPRTGKTTLAKFLISLFAKNPDTLSLQTSTPTAFTRKLSQTFNIPQLFEEYSNSIGDKKIQALKDIFNLMGKTMGVKSNDSRTVQTKVTAPTIVVGEEPPIINEALLSRFIIIELTDDKKTPQKRTTVRNLQREVEKGLGKILLEILSFREAIVKNFDTQYYKVIEMFDKELADTEQATATRLVKNYATLITPLIIAIQNGFSALNEASKDLIPWLIQEYSKELIRQAKYEKENDELTIFWDIVTNIVDSPSLQDKYSVRQDFDFKTDYQKGVFCFKASMLDAYAQYYFNVNKRMGKHRKALIEYLKSEAYYKKYDNFSFSNPANPQTLKQSKAYIFDIHLLRKVGVNI